MTDAIIFFMGLVSILAVGAAIPLVARRAEKSGKPWGTPGPLRSKRLEREARKLALYIVIPIMLVYFAVRLVIGPPGSTTAGGFLFNRAMDLGVGVGAYALCVIASRAIVSRRGGPGNDKRT